MVYTIPAGKHRATPVRTMLFKRLDKQSFYVSFKSSCRYQLGTEDQDDTNKLFGVGFVRDPLRALTVNIKSAMGKGIVAEEHHKDSARIGWVYNADWDKVLLRSYCYVNSRRLIRDIGVVPIGEKVRLSLRVLNSAYFFAVGNHTAVVEDFSHNKRWMFPLSPYFGGNLPAPHDIHIEIA